MEPPATLRHEGEKFLHFIVMGDEIWVNHAATTKKTMTWKYQSSLPAKKIEAPPSGKKIKEHVFWGNEGEILVDFLDPTDTVHAERLCDTLQGLL
jgi:hypothetical protein